MSRLVVTAFFGILAAAFLGDALGVVRDAVVEPGLRAAAVAVYAALRTAVLVAFAVFVLLRAPALRPSREPVALVAALTGMFALVALRGPSDAVPGSLVLAGDFVLLLGAAWMLVSILALGRCFGVLPEARGLVTGGPYRFVRHPLYLGEITVCAGLVLAAPTAWNAGVVAVFLIAQGARMLLEERALSEAFPEYATYAAATPRLLPRRSGRLVLPLALAAALLVGPRLGTASTYTIVPGGPSVTVTTTVADENATVTFAGTAGRRVSLKLANVAIGTSTCCSTKVSIAKPDGTALVAATNVGTRGGFLDTKTLPVSGPYKILVDPQGTAKGSATLTLYDVPPDSAATVAPGGAPVTVSTTVPGQNAKTTFAGAVGRRISLGVSGVTIGTSTNASVKVSVTKPDGTTLVSPTLLGTSGGFIDTKTLPVSGTYMILVDPQSFDVGNATLTLYDVPPEASATIVPGGPPVALTTTVPGQNAKATFAGTAGRGVALSISGVTIGPSTCCSTKVSILKPNGTALAAAVTIGTNGGFIDTKTLPVTGAYTILVDPQSASTGSATLTLHDVPPEATATITADGPPVSITLAAPYQNGRVSFAGVAGDSVSVRMTFTPTTCCTANVSILKPNGTTLANPIGVAAGSNFIDAKTLPVTGTYTIYVDPQGTATGTMTLTLHGVPADVQSTISIGGPVVTLTTTTPGQNAKLTFSGTAGQGITLHAGPNCCSTKISILKPDGTTLVAATSFGSSGGKLNTSLPLTGTYTILVDLQGDATGSVSVRLTVDSTPPATPVLTLTEASASSHVRATTFYFRPAGTGASLTVAAATSDADSGVKRVLFPALAGGFTPTTASSDYYSPYSQTYSWTTGASYSSSSNTVTAYDNVGNTSSSTFTIVPDATPPTTTDNTASIGSSWKNTNQIVTLTVTDGTGSGAAATHSTTNGTTPTTPSPQGTSISLAADGVYTIKYFSVDNVANAEAVKTAGTQIRIDKTPPSSATLAPLPAQIRNGQVLTASASDGLSGIASIAYYYCAGVACTPTSPAGSSTTGPGYAVTWSSQPVDGTYQVLARATDAAGNTRDSATQTVTIDNTAPDTTITSAPGDPSTSDVSFAFVSASASSFQCRLDGGAFVVCTSPAGYTGLASGAHTFAVRAIDPAGNVDPTPASFSWTVDAVAPDTTIDSSPADPTNAAGASFAFTSSEGGSTFECELDGGGFSACTDPKSYSGLAEGAHTFKVRATDAAGNTDGSPASYTWTIDTTAPNTTITSNPADPTNATGASFSFTSSEGGSSFACRLDGGSWGVCTSPKSYTGLADGSHTFDVRATDLAGNTDGSPASYTWTIDTTAPNTTITSNPADPTNASGASFGFSSSESGSTFECELGGGFSACTDPKSYTGLGEGAHTFKVRASDALGNTDASPATFTWTVDTAPPDTTITSGPSDPTASPDAVFSFTSSEPGSTFSCSLDGAPAAACSDPAIYTGLAAGPHVFEVVAADAAGNTDPTAATYGWTIA